MEFTCLSKGRGFDFPPCHILNICGFRVLLDAPLDLSAALATFSPVPEPQAPSAERRGGAEGLIRSEPRYKTFESLNSSNASLVDVVLVSSPMGMLGLPFLTRLECFSAKVFATEATAKLGQLMLDDLVSMHMEFRQFYGAEEPALGKDGANSGDSMVLYSAVDVKDCIQKIHSLRHAEETCYNGTLVVKPLCSGLEIGACNWTISSPKWDVGFISGSVFSSGLAMDFDYRALEGNDLIIYSDFSSLDDIENVSADDSSSPRSLDSDYDYSEEMEKLAFVSSCAIDAVKTGGSVLVPINRIGIILQLLEQVSAALEISDLKIPIYFISSVAEELLAYTNVIPEWLCRERQGKLFSGEPSFAHTALVKEKKLHVFPAIHSPELPMKWHEPCIVFSPSWSLRLGPTVHLLRRWCRDPNSLLVLEDGTDAELALLPYKPVAMKVLQCSFISGIRLRKVQPLLEALQPKEVLFPDNFKKVCFPRPMMIPVLHYEENKTLHIPKLKSPEIEIPMDLAAQFHFKKLKQQEHISVARLNGELVIRHGKHRLLSVDKQADPNRGPGFYWGSPDIQSLLSVLSKKGIKGALEVPSMEFKSKSGSDCVALVSIHEPSTARVQIRETSTIVTASDESLASNITEAVCSTLAGV